MELPFKNLKDKQELHTWFFTALLKETNNPSNLNSCDLSWHVNEGGNCMKMKKINVNVWLKLLRLTK